MKPLAPVMRISAGLVLLTGSILVLLDLFGLVPRPTDAALQARIHLCETLAAQAAGAAERSPAKEPRTHGAPGDLPPARRSAISG